MDAIHGPLASFSGCAVLVGCITDPILACPQDGGSEQPAPAGLVPAGAAGPAGRHDAHSAGPGPTRGLREKRGRRVCRHRHHGQNGQYTGICSEINRETVGIMGKMTSTRPRPGCSVIYR